MNNTKRETIIEKIRKMMALASNNPSEAEATSAALMAQKLMAKYHVEEKELGEDISESNIESLTIILSGKVQKWRISLAQALARNFRCRVYLVNGDVTFYGFTEDIQICSEVFKSLYSIGNKLSEKAKREVRKEDGTAKGVKNSFCLGFVSGIRKELEKQCTALMVVVPQEVNDQFEEMTANFKVKSSTIKTNVNSSAYIQGFQAGRDAMQAKKITG